MLAPELLDTRTRLLALTEDSNDTRSATGRGRSAPQFFQESPGATDCKNAPCWDAQSRRDLVSASASGKHMIETPYAPCAPRRIKTKRREYSEGCRAWL
jgi:hypothetical protein